MKTVNASKQEKLIIKKVTVKHAIDTDPDTSWLGEYSDRPSSEFSIDRATDEFQGDIDAGKDWLNRAQSRIEDMQQESDDRDLQDAYQQLEELKDEFDNVSWDSRRYRYFNPSDNYTGEPAEDIRSYVKQDLARMDALDNQNWYFMGVSATAEVWNPKTHVIQRIHSGGLWGIESDSGREYIESVEQEQLAELKTELTALGFSKRAIAKAFQNIERKD